MNLVELESKGWIFVEGITCAAQLLDLGRSLGTCVPTPNGEIVKEIRRTSRELAPPGSQSAKYGSGPFPLHTDTVFWPTPVRYVILRGYGDTRRPTTIRSFDDLTRGCDSEFHIRARHSVWRVQAGPKSFYCSMYFRQGNSNCWRYDADLMTPVNESAIYVQSILNKLVYADVAEGITWSGDKAVVIANWITLHGRGHQPPNEGSRIIERLYVR